MGKKLTVKEEGSVKLTGRQLWTKGLVGEEEEEDAEDEEDEDYEDGEEEDDDEEDDDSEKEEAGTRAE